MTSSAREAHTVQQTESALLTASVQVLEGLASGQRPLSTVSASLADLATALDVEQVIVAIDDAELGRQLFSSGRTPLSEIGELFSGPPRARTDPPSRLDNALDRLIVASVSAALERARSSAPAASGQLTPSGVEDPAGLAALVNRIGVAADRCTRYGWGFTLVVLRLDESEAGAVRQIESQLRASDTVVDLGEREIGIMLPAAPGDEVPRILARVGRHGAVSTFCYGLAACPGDATDPTELLALATSRLGLAAGSRTTEIHSLDQGVV